MPRSPTRWLAIPLIGVVRAWAIARHRHLGITLASDTATPLAILGGLILWLLPPGHPRWLEVGERYADIP